MSCTDKCSVLRRRVELEAWQTFCVDIQNQERQREIVHRRDDPRSQKSKQLRKHWKRHLTAANQEHIDHALANDYDYRDYVGTEYESNVRIRAKLDDVID